MKNVMPLSGKHIDYAMFGVSPSSYDAFVEGRRFLFLLAHVGIWM